jgi:pimeloyl-ACP methyl ester carboxylesterase
VKRIDSDFMSNGLKCSAWLYLPDGKEKPPVIIMAHGLSGQKDFGLQNYAEYFAGHGMAALVFDYRNFGDSQGEPRNLVNPWRQLQDWRSAISHVKNLDAVDGNRLALWGTSFSGGHVLVTAAKERGIKAIVAQVPFVDGMSSTMQFPVSYQVQGVVHGLRDLFNMIRGKAPHTVPAVGQPGAFALMNTPECMQGYYSLVPEDTTWKNEVPARFTLMVSAYRPTMYARRITSPVFIMYAKKDSLIPYKAVERMGRKIPRAEVVGLDVGHFEIYNGELFKMAVKKQAEFLKRNLDA